MLRLCLIFVLSIWSVVAAAEITGKIHVIDADTIEVAGARVRLHAIDAPEMDQHCETQAGLPLACGQWATTQVKRRFGGQMAHCIQRDVDRYGRIVAKCQVGDADMGEVIVAEGWAFAHRRFGLDYDLTEKAAFAAARGLHGVGVQSPAQFRAAKVKARTLVDPICVIKGNISKKGRIFHVPGQEFYHKTKISETRGERWFCSAAQARDAGWRAALP